MTPWTFPYIQVPMAKSGQLVVLVGCGDLIFFGASTSFPWLLEHSSPSFLSQQTLSHWKPTKSWPMSQSLLSRFPRKPSLPTPCRWHGVDPICPILKHGTSAHDSSGLRHFGKPRYRQSESNFLCIPVIAKNNWGQNPRQPSAACRINVTTSTDPIKWSESQQSSIPPKRTAPQPLEQMPQEHQQTRTHRSNTQYEWFLFCGKKSATFVTARRPPSCTLADSRTLPGETLVEAHSVYDVQIEGTVRLTDSK